MLNIGLAKEIITPPRGIPLVGYFNPRPNTGIYDDLMVKVMLFEQDGNTIGLAVYDLCFLSTELVAEMKAALKKAGVDFADNLMFTATHTHTGPFIARFFGSDPDREYLDSLVEKTVTAVKNARKSLASAQLRLGRADNNPYSYNRRYWMKNGKVQTNPGKLNPQIERPEGPVNQRVEIMTVTQDDRVAAIVAHISNHTDTIGGNFVSADWPGRMEREIQQKLGYDVPVYTLIDCQGNINHFDVASGISQTSYTEACRIGKGYAEIIVGELGKLREFNPEGLKATLRTITIPFRDIPAEKVEDAKKILAKPVAGGSGGDMTSEGLATGDGPVARFFAEQMVAYCDNCAGKARDFELVSLKFGRELAITSIPGEAFVEIGEAIRQGSPYSETWPVVLAMGECGYIPMEECFERGGYEVLPVEGGSPKENTDKLLISESLKNLA